MDSELHATELKCRDGVTISVHALGPRLTIVTAPDDAITAASALSRYRRESPAGPGYALYGGGMPVEAVRSYCRMHGGVAQIGETARSLLQALPSEADLASAAPPAAETPITDSRAGIDAGTHDFLGRPLSPGQLDLDALTPAVIEARRGLAEAERPLDGRGLNGSSPRVAALERRAEIACLSGRGLCIVDRPRYAAHPLKAEAIKLRKRLADVRTQALADIAREA